MLGSPPFYEDYHLLCLLFKTWGRRDLRDVKGLGDPHLGLYRFSFVCVANLQFCFLSAYLAVLHATGS